MIRNDCTWLYVIVASNNNNNNNNTPTLRADGEYAWNKIIPCSHQSEIPELNIDGNMNHIELCHTKGVHYDLIVLKNGTYPTDFPDHTMCM